MPLASCWTSARNRWSSIWTDISYPQRNRSSHQPRMSTLSHLLNFCPLFLSVLPSFLCFSLLFLLSFLLLSIKPPFFSSPLSVLGPVSSLQPALCHTNSVSLTLGPSLSVTHLLSSSAPSMTLLHCCPVKRSSYPGKKVNLTFFSFCSTLKTEQPILWTQYVICCLTQPSSE